MTDTCLTCQAIGCGGLQYNPYRNEWYCPVFNVETVADNKTIPQEVRVNNVTTSNDGVMPFKRVSSPRIAEEEGRVYYVDREHKIDLTSMYGKGNEPKTVEELENIYPIAFLDGRSLT